MGVRVGGCESGCESGWVGGWEGGRGESIT